MPSSVKMLLALLLLQCANVVAILTTENYDKESLVLYEKSNFSMFCDSYRENTYFRFAFLPSFYITKPINAQLFHMEYINEREAILASYMDFDDLILKYGIMGKYSVIYYYHDSGALLFIFNVNFMDAGKYFCFDDRGNNVSRNIIYILDTTIKIIEVSNNVTNVKVVFRYNGYNNLTDCYIEVLLREGEIEIHELHYIKKRDLTKTYYAYKIVTWTFVLQDIKEEDIVGIKTKIFDQEGNVFEGRLDIIQESHYIWNFVKMVLIL